MVILKKVSQGGGGGAVYMSILSIGPIQYS